jgi:hypothetical protein
MIPQATVVAIIEGDFQGTLIAMQELVVGYVSRLYALTVRQGKREGQLCIKFTETTSDADYDALSVDKRIYAARHSNFHGAYHVLTKANLPVPTVYSSRSVMIGKTRWSYQVMALLAGIDVRNTLAFGEPPAANELHALTGAMLARMHAITRPYDGWVDQMQPYQLPWRDAFFQSLHNQLSAASQVSTAIRQQQAAICAFIDQQATTWVAPTEFVLSHVDGLQAMAAYQDGQWHFTGFVDLEDHCFVDQRFVLAGHELIMRVGRRELPSAFWDAYQAIKAVPASYHATRPLFQLYYLLSWLTVFYQAVQRDPGSMHATIATHEQLIYQIIHL